MYSPTGYVADFPDANAGIGWALPIVAFDEYGEALVCSTSGSLRCVSDMKNQYGRYFVRPLKRGE